MTGVTLHGVVSPAAADLGSHGAREKDVERLDPHLSSSSLLLASLELSDTKV